MQRTYLVRVVLILVLMAGSFFVIYSSSRITTKDQNCTESMEACCKKEKKIAPPGDMLWESLSRQFVASVVFSN